MTPALSKRKKYYMEQSILRTLAYFDLADYPLTKEELLVIYGNLPPFPTAFFRFFK